MIEAWRGDITTLKVDAIVNAANSALIGGGGVDGAIHAAAGPKLDAECAALSGCATGQAKITEGYNLPARYIIHTVGPIYGEEDGNEELLLISCYMSSLIVAMEHGGIKSVAFPAISTGAFRYPKWDAAKIAVNAIIQFEHLYPDTIDKVVLVAYDEKTLKLYSELIKKEW